MKHLDILGAWGCSGCHDFVDGRTNANDHSQSERMLHLHRGVTRTIEQLWKLGYIKTGNNNDDI